LHRQRLVDRLEGHLIDDDLDLRIFGFKFLQDVGDDLAFVAIRIPGHAQLRLRKGG
jgi:hypothetical protein